MCEDESGTHPPAQDCGEEENKGRCLEFHCVLSSSVVVKDMLVRGLRSCSPKFNKDESYIVRDLD